MRRNFFLSAVLVLIAAAVGWVTFRGRAPAGMAAQPPPAARSRAIRPRISTWVRAEPAPSVPPAGTVQVCGYGTVPVDLDDPTALWTFLGRATRRTSGAWLAALLDSDDLRARAVGMVFEGKMTGGETLRPTEEATRDALVQLAVGSADPAVYAMALDLCSAFASTPVPGACRQLSVAHWANLDPDNATPWLMVAGQARRAHDTAAEAAAFARAAQAQRVDGYNSSMLSYASAALPPDATPLARWFLATEAVGIEAAYSPPLAATFQHCSADAVRDDQVRQDCAAVAQLLVGRATNLLDFMAGTSLGARAGWPPERVAALTRERDALLQAVNEAAPQKPADMWTCEGVRRGNAYMEEWMRSNELAAARAALERSGESVSVMAQRYALAQPDVGR